MPRFGLNRRGFLGGLAVLGESLLGRQRLLAAARPSPGKSEPGKGKITGFGESGNVYAELGMTTVINAHLTETVIGGSILRPEALAVMEMAAKHLAVIMDLEAAVGKRISEMLKLPQGYGAIVTSGAAAAILNGYAAILTGNDPKFIQQIPDLTGMKSEVIIQRAHRSEWDHQIRTTGAKIVEVVTVEDVHRAINERTAAMHFQNWNDPDGQINRADWLKLAHDAKIPTFLDAAADVPPKSRLWEYANMGFDLITFSGGKAIRGPQTTGLLIGRQEMVHNALLNMSPNEDTIGRPNKVGKEEMLGLLKALEIFLAEDQDAVDQEQTRQLETIANKVSKIPGVTFTRNVSPIKNHFPSLQVHLDPARFSATPRDIAAQLGAMKPSIIVGGGASAIEMAAIDLQPGEEKIVADALASVLTAHSV
ncbi:MAG TPA: aminotransferase class V-fold PLP-dependent enzyme [Edaphobacter sp.]|nr:aminotransferase class V-fold PLP-dependent enzyme [Edaphobacter sp.]